ncbi:MAG: hypothetical protein LUB59_00055 [Candidatus Gastranaerophilales bacterium]|nr:hypothetical protein [Candidatus Gastranaerophilales bacterium]
MSGLDKNRNRNQTVCFRATPEERRQIEARILVTGLPKGEYYRQSLLHQQITISVGKYQSDRLSLEIRKLREQVERLDNICPEATNEVLLDCRALLEELAELINKNSEELQIKDLATEK